MGHWIANYELYQKDAKISCITILERLCKHTELDIESEQYSNKYMIENNITCFGISHPLLEERMDFECWENKCQINFGPHGVHGDMGYLLFSLIYVINQIILELGGGTYYFGRDKADGIEEVTLGLLIFDENNPEYNEYVKYPYHIAKDMKGFVGHP